MARTASEAGRSSRKTAAKSAAAKPGMSPRRQRLWRDLALIAIAPLLLYLLACLFTYSPNDPAFDRDSSLLAPIHNLGGIAGAWIASFLLFLCGYVAFLLPLVLGAIAWIALFGMDSDGDGDVDLGPALRLVGIVGFLVASCGLLSLRGVPAENFSAGAGGILGGLTAQSLLHGIGPIETLKILFADRLDLLWFHEQNPGAGGEVFGQQRLGTARRLKHRDFDLF